MGAAIVLHPDGSIVDVSLKQGKNHLALMYEHLGCSRVDCVALTSRIDMWIDDEGLFTQPVNRPATALARYYGFTWQPYHGPVLLCSVNDHGDSIDLDTGQLRALLTTLYDAADSI